MSTKIYKIAYREDFFKHVKKYDQYTKYEMIGFLPARVYNTYQEAQAGIEEYVANGKNVKYNLPEYHWEHISDNTYKLTWPGTKSFRMMSFQICEFDTLVVMDPEEMKKVKETIIKY